MENTIENAKLFISEKDKLDSDWSNGTQELAEALVEYANKLNKPDVIKSCHEDSEDQYCGRGYPRNDKGCKGCSDWF